MFKGWEPPWSNGSTGPECFSHYTQTTKCLVNVSSCFCVVLRANRWISMAPPTLETPSPHPEAQLTTPQCNSKHDTQPPTPPISNSQPKPTSPKPTEICQPKPTSQPNLSLPGRKNIFQFNEFPLKPTSGNKQTYIYIYSANGRNQIPCPSQHSNQPPSQTNLPTKPTSRLNQTAQMEETNLTSPKATSQPRLPKGK